MVRLSATEAVSLHTETSKTPAHATVLIVIDGLGAGGLGAGGSGVGVAGRIGHQRLHRLVGSSLPAMARFRSRLVDKPLGLGQPVWAEVEDYNPSRQLRRVAVPAPGGPGELTDLVAKLTARPLDRHLPLWQAWSIEGLQGDRWALALKLSPATTGGLRGVASVLSRLLTVGADDNPVESLPVEQGLGKLPSIAALIGETAAELAGNQLAGARMVGAALPGALRAVLGRLSGGNEHDARVPRTAFNEPLTERRAIALTSIPQADLDAVADAFGVGVNDVFLTACTLSVRTWLQRHDAVPDYPLLMQTLLPDGDSFGQVRLPVQLDDPARILTGLQRSATDFARVAGLVAPSVVHAGMRVYSRLELSRRLPPVSHGVAAHLVGPGGPAYCAGGEVVGIYVVPPLFEGAGLNITAVSHGEVIDVSVGACPDRVGSVDLVADGIADAVGQLRAMRKKKNRPQR
jgi:diacylglycerol O-acyltransferase / wax synthase